MEEEARIRQLLELHSWTDFKGMGIYGKWKDSKEPFDRTNPEDKKHTKFQIADKVRTLEDYDDIQGEKFGLDDSSGTYFYEKWTPGYLLKQWKTPDSHWGEIRLSSPDSIEKWSESGSETTYEKVNFTGETESKGRKFGQKTGIRWFENWLESPSERFLDKSWETLDRSWGEKEGFRDGRKWSETWERNGDTFSSQATNTEGSRSWGKIEGRNKDETWGENWSEDGSETLHDRFWSKNDRKWGTKTVAKSTGITITEDWEETGNEKKLVFTQKDGLGNVEQTTTGKGDGYEYTDLYTETAETGSRMTVRKGVNGGNSWVLKCNEEKGKYTVENEGKNDTSSWTEAWSDDGQKRWAKKTGKNVGGEEWDEEWTEREGCRECSKHGKNAENEWWEEWSETGPSKHCKKTQQSASLTQTQEWTEVNIDSTHRHSTGYFSENGTRVKEWDEIYTPEA